MPTHTSPRRHERRSRHSDPTRPQRGRRRARARPPRLLAGVPLPGGGLTIANQLGIATADQVLVVERLHQAGGVPFAVTLMHVREDIIGRLDETDVAENTLYKIAQERGLGAFRGERSLSAWPAPVDVATAFGLAPGDPILVSIGGMSGGDGRPLDGSVFSFHPLHYGFRFSFEHGSGTADGHNLDTNL